MRIAWCSNAACKRNELKYAPRGGRTDVRCPNCRQPCTTEGDSSQHDDALQAVARLRELWSMRDTLRRLAVYRTDHPSWGNLPDTAGYVRLEAAVWLMEDDLGLQLTQYLGGVATAAAPERLEAAEATIRMTIRLAREKLTDATTENRKSVVEGKRVD